MTPPFLRHPNNPMTPLRYTLITASVVLSFFAACQNQSAPSGPTALYFSSPAASVTIITPLLRAHDWSTLARYYDLTGSGRTYADASREDFFLRRGPTAPAQPSEIGAYRQPFAPGFTFEAAAPSEQPDVTVVTVVLAIDQGGGPVQRVRTTYRLRHSASGYQLLPSGVIP